ncbi:MAG: hypothetical protein M3R46_01855 [Actinomycetota bacterium]|nr:hypothetical protein [Actinomycetota bacterium]
MTRSRLYKLRIKFNELRSAPQKLAQFRALLEGLREVPRELSRASKDVKDFSRELKRVYAELRRIELRFDGVLRHLYFDAQQLTPPADLTWQRFKVYSQNGEDGLTLALLKRIGFGAGRFVDIGCGPMGGNARFFAEEFGWSGLFVDAREQVKKLEAQLRPGQVTALATWITRDNVDSLVRDHGFDGEIDLLSIDLDGNDYWIWEALTACSPRIAIVEYNSFFGPDRAVTVPYLESFDRHERDRRYYGASLAALVALARQKGYRLVAVEPAGVNAFFLRDDVAPEIPGFRADQLYRPQAKHHMEMTQRGFDPIEAFTPENGLPLIDVA